MMSAHVYDETVARLTKLLGDSNWYISLSTYHAQTFDWNSRVKIYFLIDHQPIEVATFADVIRAAEQHVASQ